jgi:hypothetical protein
MSVEQVEIKKEVFRPADILLELEEPIISFIFENKISVALPVLLRYDPVKNKFIISKAITPQLPARLEKKVIDLTTARTKETIARNVFGATIFSLDGNVTLTIKNMDGTEDSYDFQPLLWPSMIYLQAYIYELQVTNTAQSGKTLVLALDRYG